MKYLKLLFVFFFVLNQIFSQQFGVGPSRVLSSPDGNYVFLLDKAKSIDNPYQNSNSYTISRAAKGSTAFQKVGVLQKPKSIQDLSAKLKPETIANLRRIAKAQNDQELIAYLNKSNTKEYGLEAFDLDFMQAIGLVYLDKEAKGNKNLVYRLEPSNGSKSQTINYEEPVFDPTTDLLRRPIPKFSVKAIFATDSIARVKWSAIESRANNQIYLGKVYKQSALKGPFLQIGAKVIALFNNKADSLHYFFEETTKPENIYRYYVAVSDFVGNELARTDTATLISVDFNKIPMIKNVVIKDTLDGLVVKWKKLPTRPYYTGIEISRSRDVRGNFIVIDTLAYDETRFIDQKMLPNVNYYYQLRPLLYAINNWGIMPSTPGNYFFQNKNRPPLPAHGLKVSNEGQGVRLSWKKTSDVDIFGYYVMRSTSEKMKFEVVSPALNDTTYLDTTSTLNGRSQYLYAIKIVNMNAKESALSEQISIRPFKYEFLHGPTGINGYTDIGKVFLHWDDAKKFEPAVIGYLLYKRIATGKPIIDNNKSAFYSAEKNGFKLAFPQVIAALAFNDDNIERGLEYEYAVAAVDAFQLQSPLSPVTKQKADKSQIFPPSQVYVRNTTKGIEVAWASTNLPNIIGFNVYRRTKAENIFQKIGTTKVSEIVFMDITAKPKTHYLYTITYQTKDTESTKSIEKAIVRN
jgi:fibronectin type 3 domain-containing protein